MQGPTLVARFVALALLGIPVSRAAAQAPRPLDPVADVTFEELHWTIEHGLPVDRIDDVVQTLDGFVWIATTAGLIRFDGHSFRTYTPGNSPGLDSGRIAALHADRLGALWIVSDLGTITRYAERTFERLHHADGSRVELAGPAIHYASRFRERTPGEMFFSSRRGLVSYRDSLRILPLEANGKLTGLAAAGNSVWVGTTLGELFHVSAENEVTSLHRAGEALGSITQVVASTETAVWIASDLGVFELANDRFVQRWRDDLGVITPLIFGCPCVDGRPAFWTIDGFIVAVEPDGELRHIFHTHFAQRSTRAFSARTHRGPSSWTQTLAMEEAMHIYRDGRRVAIIPHLRRFYETTDGGAVMATAQGLVQLRPHLVAAFRRPAGFMARDFSTNAYPIVQDQEGAVWAGSIHYELLRLTGSTVDVWDYESRGLEVGHPWSALALGNGSVIAAGRGMQRVFPLPVSSLDLPEPPPVGEIRTLFEDSGQRLWIGGEVGVGVLDRGRWTKIEPPEEASPWVRTIAETADGAIWMATNGRGVYRYHEGDLRRLGTENGGCSNFVRDIHEAEDGSLWLATEDVGLCRVRGHAGLASNSPVEVVSIGEPEGLPLPGVHRILEDSSAVFWLNTNQNILSIPRGSLDAVADGVQPRVRPIEYGVEDGSPHAEGNGGMQPAGLLDRLGRIWFPTQDGVAMIDPVRIRQAPTREVVIESVSSGGVPIDWSQGADLSREQRDLAITFTAADMLQPHNLQFQYRIGDQEWTALQGGREVRLTNLSAGQQSVEIRVADRLGFWNDARASLTVYRQPTFTESRWFIPLLGLLLIGAALSGAAIRNRQLRARNAELQRRVDRRTVELRAALDTVSSQADELKSLDEAKTKFFANVSHELRTPLTLIIGPLRSLLDGRYGQFEEAADHQFRVMLRNSQRLLRLVNQILGLAQFDAGQHRVRLTRQPLVPFVERLVEPFRPLATRWELDLTFSAARDPGSIAFDAEHLEVILLNLVSNAIKFTPAGGSVEVNVDTLAGDVLVSVRDTGRGIAPDALDKIFERFYQEAGSPGTGIGLTLVQRLVEAHQGRVEVESEVGRGSVFTVRLPMDLEPTAAPDGAASAHFADLTAAEPEPTWSASSIDLAGDEVEDRTTVLVVDDSRELREYVGGLLGDTYRVIEAADGDEAVERVRSELPDLIVSDVMMPGTDGFGLSRALKANAMTAHIPLILLTARASKAALMEGLEAGADDYLTKPFNPDELLARIRNQLATRQSLRARFQSGETARAPAESDELSLAGRARALTLERMGDPEYSVEDLADALFMSYSTFRRRLNEETGESPASFVRRIRLEQAAELLLEGAGSVSEVAYGVGFNHLSYFSRRFKETYGMLPSEYGSERHESVS